MRTFYYDTTQKNEYCDKEKKTLAYISNKNWKQYIKGQDNQYRIVGETKLKLAEPSKDESVLSAVVNDCTIYYQVKDRQRFCSTLGYLPVGGNEYLKIVKTSPLPFIFLALLCIAIGLGLYYYVFQNKPPEVNRFLEDPVTEERHTQGTSTRFRFNTTMTVTHDTIQNLDFENVNTTKQLQIKIKLHPEDTDYIYDSGLIPPGKAVYADVLQHSAESGSYKTIAECYTYNEEGEQLSQTDFEITLIIQ